MRGKPLGLAVLGLAISSLAALAQVPSVPTTPAKVPSVPTTPAIPKTPARTISPTLAAATVNGEPIYEVAVQRALDRGTPPERRDAARKLLIGYLADNLVIDQSLRMAPAYKVTDAEIDKRVNESKAQLKKFGRDFNRMLGELRVTEAEFRTHVGADLRWDKYANSQATEKTLLELFTRERDLFDGTRVRARHILITPASNDEKSVKAAADQLVAIKKAVETEVQAGLAKLPATADKLSREKARTALVSEAFGRQAKAHSACPTKAGGGDVNWFEKAGLMVAPFANAAFALQVGQMSDVVRTQFGLHVILVTDRRAGKEVKFEAVKEVVKAVYFDRLHEHVAAHLRARAKIVINPPPR